MFGFLRRKTAPPAPPLVQSKKSSVFSTHPDDGRVFHSRAMRAELARSLTENHPRSHDRVGMGIDSIDDDNLRLKTSGLLSTPVNDLLLSWYGRQSFIGWQTCAIMAQNPLISKACSIPGRDATRQWFTIKSHNEEELEPKIVQTLERIDKKFKLKNNLQQFVKMGRVFGIRLLMFNIKSGNEDYDREFYESPFNIDGVKSGSYKGISQVDPYWCAPILSHEAASDATAIDFYEPTWWIIQGKKVHRSHLCIFRGDEVPDILKPMYLYGGIPVTQKIFYRVYSAERLADEALMLAMSKRLNVFACNAEQSFSNKSEFDARMRAWVDMRDNYGVKIIDQEQEEITQHETSLENLDELISGQYQLVAAMSDVTATKLMETTPKGWQSTGEHEAENYRIFLEGIQDDMAEVIERHHHLAIKSYIAPKYGNVNVCIQWNPADSPTAAELADINLKKAQTTKTYVDAGALDPYDVRDGLINDPDSGFSHIEAVERPGEIDLEPQQMPGGFPGGGNPWGDEGPQQQPSAVTDAGEFVMSEFVRGFEIEMEHAETVGGDLLTVAKIVLDHLAENPRYYSDMQRAGFDASVSFREEDHPREKTGKFTAGSGGGGRTESKIGPDESREIAQSRGYRVPPAWKNVWTNPDKNADLQVTGIDAKGRKQYIYSVNARNRADAEKFARLKSFSKTLPKIEDKIQKDFAASPEAQVLYLIRRTGFRIGSERDTGAEKQAYGATTLTSDHVSVSGDVVTFEFTGKKGVAQKHEIKDRKLASLVAKREGKLFDTSASNVRSYLKSIGGDFKVKDFRTYVATEKALELIKKHSPPLPPKTEKDVKKSILWVAEEVSKTLGNTPQMARDSYIDPTVFKQWAVT